jgi:light-regulated signal transduction histidine kinase (bacteriophytochrome)
MPSQDTDTVQEEQSPVAASPVPSGELQIQPAGFLIQMSLDWIILRASENIDDLLGESHVTLIEEPLSRFVQAQVLHDLRNHFSRLSGSTGIARAYRVRLTDDRPRVDIAFQVSGGRVLLEAAPVPERGVGEAIGSVGGLVEGLSEHRGEALVNEAARRVRALTGCDRSLIECQDRRAQSSRAGSAEVAGAILGLPGIVADAEAAPVSIFPRKPDDRSIELALLQSPSPEAVDPLRGRKMRSAITVPLKLEDGTAGIIQCESRAACQPSFELHAAAELFAQMLALRLEVDRLRS